MIKSDDFNNSMRKFLKQVGVISQQAIEEAMRGAETAGKTYAAKAVIITEEVDVGRVVTGKTSGQD